MKTSNILFTGLLSVIFIVIIAFILEIRVFGEHKSERTRVSKTENINIGDFKHVVVENLRTVKISPSETNHIHFIAYDDTTKIGIQYTIENDTLKMIRGNKSSSTSYYVLYTNSKIESLTVKDCNVQIDGLQQDKLFFKVNNGEINSFGNNKKGFSYIKKVNVAEINSRINFQNTKVDTLQIHMENSYAGFNKDIDRVIARIKFKSNLHLENVDKLELEKDENSRIYLR